MRHGCGMASMGPAVFTAGERAIRAILETGDAASMGPAVFTAGEGVGPPRSRMPPRAASMGPAVFTAGEWRCSTRWCRRCSGFNGARGFHRGRGRASTSRASTTTAGFNGARGFHRGRGASSRVRDEGAQASMGPAVFTAGEDARRHACGHAPRPASMGPAVFTAGEKSSHGKTAFMAMLQWGPRFSPRESSQISGLGERRLGKASMGPAVFTAGEFCSPVCLTRKRRLQWGPRFSPRERTDAS